MHSDTDMTATVCYKNSFKGPFGAWAGQQYIHMMMDILCDFVSCTVVKVFSKNITIGSGQIGIGRYSESNDWNRSRSKKT